VKNHTVSLDDEVYQKARVAAAEKGASVSAFVRSLILEFVDGEDEFDRLTKLENELRSRIGYFSASDRIIPRDEIYRRDI